MAAILGQLVRLAGKILEAELRITGKDGTGAAFAGVIKHAEQLKATLAGMQGMRSGGADFAAANAAIKEQTTLLRTERIAASTRSRRSLSSTTAPPVCSRTATSIVERSAVLLSVIGPTSSAGER